MYIKKRKAGADINSDIDAAVLKKHKRTVVVASWSTAGRSDFAIPIADTTAEMLSSQQAEARLDDVPDLQDQVALPLRQGISDMQHRIQRTASLVVGQLLRRASVEEADKKALASYVSNPLRKCKLQDWLTHRTHQKNLQIYFDKMYNERCGEGRFSAKES